jgi:hypothetical protein
MFSLLRYDKIYNIFKTKNSWFARIQSNYEKLSFMRDLISLSHFGHRSSEYAQETHRAACPHGIRAIEIRLEWQPRHFEIPQFSSKRKIHRYLYQTTV